LNNRDFCRVKLLLYNRHLLQPYQTDTLHHVNLTDSHPNTSGPRRFQWLLWPGLSLLIGFAAGCGKDAIRVYQAPKPTENHAQAEEHLHWELPDGWEEQEASGVRRASFLIKDDQGHQAEVAIMPFKKMGAGDLEFVNLWRTTMGLQPVDESRLSEMVHPVRIGDQAGKLFDVIDSANEQETSSSNRIIVAQALRGDSSWFFKLAGSATLVEQETDAFKDFLGTVTFHEADAHGAAAQPMAGASHPPVPTPATTSSPQLPEWTVPDHWQEQPPSTMVLAKYLISGDDNTSSQLSISVFPGDVGGVLANVNRWRGQVGLPPIAPDQLDSSIEPLDLGQASPGAILVDVVSPQSGKRLIGAIIPRGGQTWFYKMMGDDAVTAREKEMLIKFIQSARYPNA